VVASPEGNPTVARRELAIRFRDLREQRGYSLTELGRLLHVAQSQASRLDTGARGFRPDQVALLCDWYALGERERTRLLELADESRRRAWWQKIDLFDSYRTLIGFEQAAESINEYCTTVIPGLLQTNDYAVAATAASGVGLDESDIERAVEVRMRRQQILERPRPPELAVVMDEAVLARSAGVAAVMKKQLDHLLDLASRPHITIQVIGFEAGLYPVSSIQFMLLQMMNRIPDIYYTDGLTGATADLDRSDSSKQDELRDAWRLWRQLQIIALNQAASTERIAAYRDRLD
jgi:transcriptional regulator with XRE-family HTH domain